MLVVSREQLIQFWLGMMSLMLMAIWCGVVCVCLQRQWIMKLMRWFRRPYGTSLHASLCSPSPIAYRPSLTTTVWWYSTGEGMCLTNSTTTMYRQFGEHSKEERRTVYNSRSWQLGLTKQKQPFKNNRIIEFDSPSVLLADQNSAFYSMVHSSGTTETSNWLFKQMMIFLLNWLRSYST